MTVNAMQCLRGNQTILRDAKNNMNSIMGAVSTQSIKLKTDKLQLELLLSFVQIWALMTETLFCSQGKYGNREQF